MYQRIKSIPHISLSTGKESLLVREQDPTHHRGFEYYIHLAAKQGFPNTTPIFQIGESSYWMRLYSLPCDVFGVRFLVMKNGEEKWVASCYVVPSKESLNFVKRDRFFSNVHLPQKVPKPPFCMSWRTQEYFLNEEVFRYIRDCAVWYWLDQQIAPQPDSPDDLLNRVMVDFPNLNAVVSEAYGNQSDDVPKHVFLPVNTWNKIGLDTYKLEQTNGYARIWYYARMIMVTQTWAYSKGIYRFENTFIQELAKTSLKTDNDIPTDFLERLPEFCIYIEMPNEFTSPLFEGRLYGFFATIAHNTENPENSHLLIFPLTDPPSSPYFLLLSDSSIEKSIELLKVNEDISPVYTPQEFEEKKDLVRDQLKFFISCVLYLCSDEPDVEGVVAGTSPVRPALKKTKQGFQLFPETKTKIYNVGAKVGKLIRTYQSEEDKKPAGEGKTHASPRPHIRTAHWHLYHVGQGRKDSRVRWIPPIVVGGSGIRDQR
ncbi:MAG: hypothetical protein LBG61_04440 [Burkholderiales bacterium]|jgi:hypothetical protein|nr:hypothetical protein [Burkholderiales bacterium]